jgi:hypothetical protein
MSQIIRRNGIVYLLEKQDRGMTLKYWNCRACDTFASVASVTIIRMHCPCGCPMSEVLPGEPNYPSGYRLIVVPWKKASPDE